MSTPGSSEWKSPLHPRLKMPKRQGAFHAAEATASTSKPKVHNSKSSISWDDVVNKYENILSPDTVDEIDLRAELSELLDRMRRTRCTKAREALESAAEVFDDELRDLVNGELRQVRV